MSVLAAFSLVLGACTDNPETVSEAPKERVDTISHHSTGAPKVVHVQRGDSVVERRAYRPTGRIRRIERGNSVQSYFDLHDPDSSETLKDFLRGQWYNTSADTSRTNASAFYVFGKDHLTFRDPSGATLESISIDYEDNQTLTTGDGMSVRTDIVSFDTVRVTGYTLVRRPGPDSLPSN